MIFSASSLFIVQSIHGYKKCCKYSCSHPRTRLKTLSNTSSFNSLSLFPSAFITLNCSCKPSFCSIACRYLAFIHKYMAFAGVRPMTRPVVVSKCCTRWLGRVSFEEDVEDEDEYPASSSSMAAVDVVGGGSVAGEGERRLWWCACPFVAVPGALGWKNVFWW